MIKMYNKKWQTADHMEWSGTAVQHVHDGYNRRRNFGSSLVLWWF